MITSYFNFIWHQSANLNNNILTSYIEPVKKAKILDLGCDDGKLIINRVANIEKPEIFGIDLRQEPVTLSKKLGIKATKGNIENGLPFKSNFFDVVSANQIIEHLVDVDKFVKEIHRVLKPKGYLILSTENLSSWHNIFALLFGWQAFSQSISEVKNIGNPLKLVKLKKPDKSGMHIKIFTPKGLDDLFTIYGFKIEKKFGAGYYPFPPLLARFFSKIDRRHSAFIGLKVRKKIKVIK